MADTADDEFAFPGLGPGTLSPNGGLLSLLKPGTQPPRTDTTAPSSWPEPEPEVVYLPVSIRAENAAAPMSVVKLSGLPSQVVPVSAMGAIVGEPGTDGVWTIAVHEIDGLHLCAPADTQPFSLAFTALFGTRGAASVVLMEVDLRSMAGSLSGEGSAAAVLSDLPPGWGR
jgi:hypothetical protein